MVLGDRVVVKQKIHQVFSQVDFEMFWQTNKKLRFLGYCSI